MGSRLLRLFAYLCLAVLAVVLVALLRRTVPEFRMATDLVADGVRLGAEVLGDLVAEARKALR